MNYFDILLPLNHFKDISIDNDVDIKILNSIEMNKILSINQETKEDFITRDYIKLVNDNEINRFLGFKDRKLYFSQPYIKVSWTTQEELDELNLKRIGITLFSFIRLYDSLFGIEPPQLFHMESWGEWTDKPSYYNTICLCIGKEKYKYFELIQTKPFLRVKENIFARGSQFYSLLKKLLNKTSDIFLLNLLETYSNLYNLVIEENFNDFKILTLSIFESIFRIEGQEKSNKLAESISSTVRIKDCLQAEVEEIIKLEYKERNKLVHSYSKIPVSKFFAKTYQFRAIESFDRFDHFEELRNYDDDNRKKRNRERILFKLIENYILGYIEGE